jgi:hypothetical protein
LQTPGPGLNENVKRYSKIYVEAELLLGWFYWDDNRGRASITRKMNQDQAREAARKLARAEFAKLERNT